MKKKNRIIGILLSLMLVLGLMPIMAYADSVDETLYNSFTIKQEVKQIGFAAPQATTFYYQLTHMIGNKDNELIPDGKTPEQCGISFTNASDVINGRIQITTYGSDASKNLPFSIDVNKANINYGWLKDDAPFDSYTCVFRLTEIGGKDTGWTYATNEYSLEFNYTPEHTITKDGETVTVPETKGVRMFLLNVPNTPFTDTAVFKNTYTYNPDTAAFSIDIDKTVEQGGTAAPGKEDFTFLLRDADGNTPADYGINITGDKISTDGKGTFKGTLKGTFDIANVFNQDGTGKWDVGNDGAHCVFYLTEQNDGKDGWKYSDKEYLVEITYDPDTMTASAVVTLPEAEVSYSTDALSSVAAFTNTYTKAAKSPETGDDSNMGLWIALMLAAVLCAGGTVLYSRRSRSEK